MAIAPRKLKSGKIVYWVTFRWRGKQIWERSGHDKRQAEALDKQRAKERAAGTYSPRTASGRVTVAVWLGRWLDARDNRAADYERALIERHVLGAARDWFAKTPLQDVQPRDVLRVVESMKAEKKIGSKTIANAYTLIRGAFKRAVFEGLIPTDPSEIPKGIVRWKSAPSSRRKPYTRTEAHRLITGEAVPPDARMWMALSFFSGMRLGEVAGRKWKDWLRSARLLSALHVHCQYDGEPLKTDDGDFTRPRMVPVHPELARMLREWWATGFEYVYLRKPTPEDWIIPRRDLACHTKSSGYKLFARALATTGIESKTLHATRNTFISIARSNGAPKDVVEKITHNAAGDVIDVYTEFEWRPLCEAVSLFDLSLDPNETEAVLGLQLQDSNMGPLGESSGKGPNDTENPEQESARFRRRTPAIGGVFDASQRRLLKLAEIDPEAARPGLAVTRGLKAALAGDEAATLAALQDGAEALAGGKR